MTSYSNHILSYFLYFLSGTETIKTLQSPLRFSPFSPLAGMVSPTPPLLTKPAPSSFTNPHPCDAGNPVVLDRIPCFAALLACGVLVLFLTPILADQGLRGQVAGHDRVFIYQLCKKSPSVGGMRRLVFREYRIPTIAHAIVRCYSSVLHNECALGKARASSWKSSHLQRNKKSLLSNTF